MVDLLKKQSDKIDWILVVLLFFIALGVRLVRLFDLDLNFDEVVLLFQIDKSFAGIWNACKADNFPPLFPWMLKIWGSVCRTDAWFRLFAALLGATAAPAAYFLGKEIFNRRLGWLPGLGTALSVSLIAYSQFVRMFSLQPLLAVLSVFWFIRALRSNRWIYWLLTAVTNLIGFYIYIFTIFLFAGELLVLIVYYRLDIKRYFRPFIASIPFFIGVMIWLIPALTRYAAMQSEGFWTVPFAPEEAIKVWVFLGTGNDFRNHYLLTYLLNLPLLIGFVLGLIYSLKNEALRIVIAIFAVVGFILIATSFFGQSFFSKPYFIFVLPFYLTVVFAGWLNVKKVLWRRIGWIYLGLSFIVALSYYYYDFYLTKEFWGFVRPRPYAEANEGHCLTTMVKDLAARLGKGDVIVHYSDPDNRFRSFFPAVYYDHRVFPEYIYSQKELSQFNGRQYEQPGDRITSLQDLQPLPKGIWLVTLVDADDFFDKDVLAGRKHPLWVYQENFPGELAAAGYHVAEKIHHGGLTALYYVRTGCSAEPAKNNPRK